MLRYKSECIMAIGCRFTKEGDDEVIRRNVKELHQTGVVALNFT